MNIPSEGIKLTKLNFKSVGEYIYSGLQSGNVYRLKIELYREKRTLSQNSLFHAWMNELSNYLKSKGRLRCNPEWCKDAMKYTYLGFEEVVLTDVVTGERKTVLSLKHTSKLKTGEMYYFMTQVQAWAMNIGCLLKVPENSEYAINAKKQSA